jgi:hypothetical protein
MKATIVVLIILVALYAGFWCFNQWYRTSVCEKAATYQANSVGNPPGLKQLLTIDCFKANGVK